MADRKQQIPAPHDQTKPAVASTATSPPHHTENKHGAVGYARNLAALALREIERRAFMAGVSLQPWVTTERGVEEKLFVFNEGDVRKFASADEAFNHYRLQSGGEEG